MNVYLAGKITANDWRTQLVPGLWYTWAAHWDHPDRRLSEQMLGRPHYAAMYASSGEIFHVVRESEMRWPTLEIPRCPRWSYVGPHFVVLGNKHYEGWESGWHGWGTYDIEARDEWELEMREEAEAELMSDDDLDEYLTDPCDRDGARAIVLELNRRAIEDCDALIAWLDADDCYGTLVEIGYAAGLGKVVGIVTSNVLHFDEEHWFALGHAHSVMEAQDPVDGIARMLERVADVARKREIARLKAMPYPAYLQTEWWASVREAALERAGHRCQLCGANGDTTLNVHHNTYENRGEERPEDLVVLCRACHAKHHDRVV